MSETYRVVVTREGADWLADVPELAGAHTDARNLETLDRYVREVIVLAADLPDEAIDGVQVVWEFHTGDSALDAELAAVRSDRERVDRERGEVESATARLADRLAGGGYSVRDTGALLGVSRARAQQLVSH